MPRQIVSLQVGTELYKGVTQVFQNEGRLRTLADAEVVLSNALKLLEAHSVQLNTMARLLSTQDPKAIFDTENGAINYQDIENSVKELIDLDAKVSRVYDVALEELVDLRGASEVLGKFSQLFKKLSGRVERVLDVTSKAIQSTLPPYESQLQSELAEMLTGVMGDSFSCHTLVSARDDSVTFTHYYTFQFVLDDNFYVYPTFILVLTSEYKDTGSLRHGFDTMTKFKSPDDIYPIWVEDYTNIIPEVQKALSQEGIMRKPICQTSSQDLSTEQTPQ